MIVEGMQRGGTCEPRRAFSLFALSFSMHTGLEGFISSFLASKYSWMSLWE